MQFTIDWLHFTPGSALTGGLILGIGASLLLLYSGKIAGISGILAYVIKPSHLFSQDAAWRALFLIGLISAGTIYPLMATLAPASIAASKPTLVMAGLLVGFGSRMGSGCTSGHGICGLSRLSLRSLVATVSFMAAGFVTTYLTLHAS